VLEALRQPALEHGVAGGEHRPFAQQVAKGELIPEALGVGGDQVQMVGSTTRVGLAEPVHLARQIRRVDIAERFQRLEACPRGLEALDADQDVDHRLGGEAGHRRAADVMDPACGPRPDAGLQPLALLLEEARPGGVVGEDPDRLVEPADPVLFGRPGGYLTVSVPSMPASLCPGTVQKYMYLPGLRFTVVEV
jgi:hypothetical protein